MSHAWLWANWSSLIQLLHAQACFPKAELGWECLPQHLKRSKKYPGYRTGVLKDLLVHLVVDLGEVRYSNSLNRIKPIIWVSPCHPVIWMAFARLPVCLAWLGHLWRIKAGIRTVLRSWACLSPHVSETRASDCSKLPPQTDGFFFGNATTEVFGADL